ncbi:DUF805 domain-containing protein [Moraxella oblonga]|uniref:DUF805 domain-containing protein n=1 Tax=Moraxella oblonga TaxID=200413 RepID=UPI000830BE40|nr:DUF805 domain-containing protein [Moraxella oblonga]
MSVHFPQNSNEHNPYSAPTADMSYDDEYFEYDTTPFYKASGRIGRVRFFAYTMMLVLCAMVAMFVLGILSAILIPMLGESVATVLGIPVIVVLWASMVYINFAPSIRRLNDLNKTGWISLLYLVPIVGILLWIYLSFARGDEGVNDYGAPAEPPSTLMTILALVLPLAFVAGLGIIAAIALPAYQSYVERAQEAQIQQMIEEAQKVQ